MASLGIAVFLVVVVLAAMGIVGRSAYRDGYANGYRQRLTDELESEYRSRK